MHRILLAMTFGLFASAAMAAGDHDAPRHASDPVAADRTVQVEAGDMWFDPETLEVSPGETVAFEITNTGNLRHEFVIGNEQAQKEHRKRMREMGASGHGGHGSHDGHGGHDMAEGGHGGQMPAVTITPGDTQTLVWTAPEGGEKLEFACNIPGHYEAGMAGEIEIQG